MNFDLTQEQRLAVESLKRFAESEIRPVAERHEDTLIPQDVMKDMLRKLAPFGIGNGWVPAEAGGAGLDLVTSGLLYEELFRIAPDVAGTAFINESAAFMVHKLGSPKQKSRYLAGLLAGDLIGCVAISEPGVGSNPRAVTTRATPTDGGYIINGEKLWISNGSISDLAMVVCRTGPDALSFFAVDREAHGYACRELHKLGLNGWSTAQLSFADVRVPADCLMGPPGVGLRETLQAFERARCFVALLAIGIARAAYEAAVTYARQREQWGKVIAGHQLVQEMIAEMATELDCARLLTYRGLSLLDQGVRCDTQTSMAKWYATEAAVRIASRAIQVHGGYGLTKEFPVERHFRNARMTPIPDGTTEIQKLIIARNILGVSAFGDEGAASPTTSRKGA